MCEHVKGMFLPFYYFLHWFTYTNKLLKCLDKKPLVKKTVSRSSQVKSNLTADLHQAERFILFRSSLGHPWGGF